MEALAAIKKEHGFSEDDLNGIANEYASFLRKYGISHREWGDFIAVLYPREFITDHERPILKTGSISFKED